MRTEHILIMRFSAIGDVAMTVPVVYSLSKQYPYIRITVLSRPYARPFFENLSNNVSFMEADFKNEYKGIKGLNKLYRRLSAKHFTAVADMHDILRTKYLDLLFRLNGYKLAVINKNRKGKKLLTRRSDKVLIQQPTSFYNYAAVLAKLGYPVDIKFTSIFHENIELPSEIGEKKEKWIGIAPFATHEGKIYPIDKMEKVVSKLSKLNNLKVFFFGGGKQEMQVLDDWEANYSNCLNASRRLGGLSNELKLMSYLDLMVSMDSANAHLAALTNTNILTIWGATHPFAGFAAWNQKAENIIQKDLPCRPCSVYGNKKCFRNDCECMNISEDIIYERILNAIDYSQ